MKMTMTSSEEGFALMCGFRHDTDLLEILSSRSDYYDGNCDQRGTSDNKWCIDKSAYASVRNLEFKGQWQYGNFMRKRKLNGQHVKWKYSTYPDTQTCMGKHLFGLQAWLEIWKHFYATNFSHPKLFYLATSINSCTMPDLLTWNQCH